MAAVSGDANLSVHEIGGEVATTRTALFVDARATEAQRKALVAMVKALASRVVGTVVEVTPASIEFVAGERDIRVTANTVRLTVRKDMSHDTTCGNKQWFEPLSTVAPRRHGHHGRERVQRHVARHEVERPEQALRVLRDVLVLSGPGIAPGLENRSLVAAAGTFLRGFLPEPGQATAAPLRQPTHESQQPWRIVMSTESTTTRREFLIEAAASAFAVGALASDVLASQQPAGSSGLPTRLLGRTGERVSILCLGGWHIGAVKDPGEAHPHDARRRR